MLFSEAQRLRRSDQYVRCFLLLSRRFRTSVFGCPLSDENVLMKCFFGSLNDRARGDLAPFRKLGVQSGKMQWDSSCAPVL